MEQKSFHLHHRQQSSRRQDPLRERREGWWHDAIADVTPKSTPHPQLPRKSEPQAENRAPQAKPSRALAQRTFGRSLINTAVRLAQRIRRWVKEYADSRRAYRELTAMNDRELQDMGLYRCDIDAVVDGSLPHDPTRIRNIHINLVRNKMK